MCQIFQKARVFWGFLEWVVSMLLGRALSAAFYMNKMETASKNQLDMGNIVFVCVHVCQHVFLLLLLFWKCLHLNDLSFKNSDGRLFFYS